jgi:WD40 repeat protein
VSTSADGTIRLWDIESGKEVRRFEGNKNPCAAVFSPDGARLISADWDADFLVRLWDIDSGKELHRFAGHLDHLHLHSVTFSPDGRLVASGSFDRTLRLWDVDKALSGVPGGPQVHPFSGHLSQVSGVAFSPDGRMLATGSSDRTVKLWDTATGRELRTLSGHQREVRAVAFSPDNQLLASACADGTVKVWDVGTGKELFTIAGHGGEVSTVAFSPDGKSLATGSHDATAKLWAITRAGASELISFEGHESGLWTVAFSPDGKTLATGSHDQGRVRLWDVGTSRRTILEGPIDHVVCVKYDAEGRQLALASYHGAVRFWDARTGEERITFQAHEGNSVPSLALSPDGRLLVSAGRDGSVFLSDPISGAKLREWEFPWPVMSAAFARDGRHLVLGLGNGTAYIFRLNSRSE